MFIDFDAIIAQENQTAKLETVRTYVDAKGRKYFVRYTDENNGSFHVVREDGYYVVPMAYDAHTCFLLCDANGLVEESKVVVAQAQAVAAIDDEIKVLEEKLAQMKAEKQAIVDAVEIKSAECKIGIFHVEIAVGTRHFTTIEVSSSEGRLLTGFTRVSHAIVGKTEILRLLTQIAKASSMSSLIDTINANRSAGESLVDWNVRLEDDEFTVALHRTGFYAQGLGIDEQYDAPADIKTLGEATRWFEKNLMPTWIAYRQSCDVDQAHTLCQIALDCGCTQYQDEDEYEFSENDAWKRWE